ncbi:Glycosyl transferase [Candidatus Methylobacter favarea]|uniref:Glycosyl transferase n=1 Tax=Candidatus Methylobacter favarea TaxID=2707345 RepID=A0A8S0Y746_9GAMM|nr:glycosyltransferase family 9 protein [Candidatus Methylobacter favarea]CAA9892859.1 Glycosyl transferase [Candidatus Methylobacter favarea]
MSSGEKVPDVSKRAAVRVNGLGDFIFVLPALQALRDTYPEAEIVFLGKPWHQDFVPGRVNTIDRVISTPPCVGVGEEPGTPVDEAALDAFFARMQLERFDIAVQLHGGGRYSNSFVCRLGARLTVGLQAQDAPPLDRTLPYIYYQNEILRYLETVALIGAGTDQIIPRVSIIDSDRAEAAAVTAGNSKQPYIIMHPGAGDARRRWPTERFGAVANYLFEAGFALYITGIEAETGLVNEFVRLTNNRAVSLAGKLSLGGLAALGAEAALVIANDTGPLHLATAAGAKTVGIYWCGNLINASPITRAKHRPLLSWMLKCADCGRIHSGDYPFTEQACRHQVSFVSNVTVDQCLAVCEELLERRLVVTTCNQKPVNQQSAQFSTGINCN